ncbi:LOW QUALITY PROTEIN: neuropeptide FF receptor 1 [Rhynchonycteris naso]
MAASRTGKIPTLHELSFRVGDGELLLSPKSSWLPSHNGSHAEATPAANLTFSSYYQHSSPVAAMCSSSPSAWKLSEPQLYLVTMILPFAHWLAFFNSSANSVVCFSLQAALCVNICPPQCRSHKKAFPTVGISRPGHLLLHNGHVAYHGLAWEGPGCSHLPLTIPA